jgi:hypothetical protein
VVLLDEVAQVRARGVEDDPLHAYGASFSATFNYPVDRGVLIMELDFYTRIDILNVEQGQADAVAQSGASYTL